MRKQKLLHNLKNDVYCKIAPSSVDGVGVFAIKKIPKTVNPFKTTSPLRYSVITLKDDDVKDLNPNVRKVLKDFCKSGDVYDVPYNGLNALDISFYMNHSNTPNVDIVSGTDEYLEFRTNRDIEVGEELLIDYRQYTEHF